MEKEDVIWGVWMDSSNRIESVMIVEVLVESVVAMKSVLSVFSLLTL